MVCCVFVYLPVKSCFKPKYFERYIPRLCSPLSGSFVTTKGRVTNGSPSFSQVFGIGNFVKSDCPLSLADKVHALPFEG